VAQHATAMSKRGKWDILESLRGVVIECLNRVDRVRFDMFVLVPVQN